MAEILITLGIIGVVAALTIPNLIVKYQKQVVAARLKKTYSILYSALNHSESDNGNLQYPAMELWDKNTYYSGTEFSDKYIYPYLNIKKSKTLINSYGDKVVFLPDGTRITYNAEIFQWPYNENAPLFLGKFKIEYKKEKEKSIAGKNYFQFDWGYAQHGKSKLVLLPIYRTGDTVTKCSDDTIRTRCAEGQPSDCAKMIICNNWKVPDNYPIKF